MILDTTNITQNQSANMTEHLTRGASKKLEEHNTRLLKIEEHI